MRARELGSFCNGRVGVGEGEGRGGGLGGMGWVTKWWRGVGGGWSAKKMGGPLGFPLSLVVVRVADGSTEGTTYER